MIVSSLPLFCACSSYQDRHTPTKPHHSLPRENITETFVYEGAPVVGRSLSFAGENIAKSEKFIFEREFQSDNTTKISMEIPDPQEDGSGLLVIMLKGVNSTDMTESSIVIIRKWSFYWIPLVLSTMQML